METVSVYVLVQSKLLRGNEITDRVVGITTDLDEAEQYKAQGIEFEYREFSMGTDLFTMGAESTQFLKEMRQFKEAAQAMQRMIANATPENQQ